MSRTYHHLGAEERAVIMLERQHGSSLRSIALRIQNRPEHIEARLVPGHWEGDFIKGAYSRSAVGVLVERKTRFVVLCRPWSSIL